ncbi:cytochrome c1 [Bartonella tamiae]|uniref:Cytochrome c1 n=1 Tax=Bartonella tamiae Th239 TaxID=1094558 RepID=J0ZLB9_9HYPH|nr:cytochrome c1 [Bartonella tamiae]EJF89203.1 hypothetical protein ME5_01754 [Bartonella tamiae Th239]EJF95394.1 hypothetical protein MEG_00127 [Bartonella tamiae Th307]
MVKKRILLFFICILSFVPSLDINAQSENVSQNTHEEHYPLLLPEKQSWSFSGPFGTYDKAQLQRGFKIYREVCSVCHSLKYVAFRDLSALGYSAQMIKTLAAEYEVLDGPNSEGEMFHRKALESDYFPSPYENDEAAKFAHNGANPGDLSLMAKARAAPRPFPGFIGDLLTNYTTAGSDYIAALLQGYQDASDHVIIADGNWYNPYFLKGKSLAMPPPLSDDIVTYDDGTAQTVDNYAKDVSAFLMWAADPHMETRKKTGFRVILFLIVFSGLVYGVKRRIWNELDTETHAQ